ncbi:DUF6723 family protein [Paraburkholderia strydomiana]|uniref:DUF6723 family protein n=1 Tax=Paraburkholderia strydomiana TaxID=1245417 RepID=UPI0020350ED3|nr:DUF6723 family protein [Paraburkholderia strydomiana]
MVRPRLIFAGSPRWPREACGTGADGYRIYATYRRTPTGAYLGELKVVRISDDRLVYPFDGAPTIGPFQDASAAREAAMSKGKEVVEEDLRNPE